MFTGLIEEIGIIKRIETSGGGKLITIAAKSIMDDMKIDDSVAINGACQTVVSLTESSFTVVAVEETLAKTTLGRLSSGRKVNLERAMRPIDRLGGHLVQGHIDCVGKVDKISKLATAVNLWVKFPEEFAKYLVRTGSICIEGVSLTSAEVSNNSFMVSIIPHSWSVTTLSLLKVGDEVNLEFDVIGKYVERILLFKDNHKVGSVFDQFKDQPEY